MPQAQLFKQPIASPYLLRYLIISVLLTLILALSSCDEKIISDNDSVIVQTPLREIIIDPSNITFEPEMGIKDTIIPINIQISVNTDDLLDLIDRKGVSIDDVEAEVLFRRDKEPESRFSVNLNNFSLDDQQFTGTYTLRISTVSLTDYILYARLLNPEFSQQTVQTNLSIQGFPAGETFIESVQHPDTVFIPNQGNVSFTIGAVAKNTVDDSSIESVFVELYDRDGIQLGGEPFLLEPDFETLDQFYSRTFQIGENNQQDEIRLEFYAVDIFGTVSDILISNFVIR